MSAPTGSSESSQAGQAGGSLSIEHVVGQRVFNREIDFEGQKYKITITLPFDIAKNPTKVDDYINKQIEIARGIISATNRIQLGIEKVEVKDDFVTTFTAGSTEGKGQGSVADVLAGAQADLQKQMTDIPTSSTGGEKQAELATFQVGVTASQSKLEELQTELGELESFLTSIDEGVIPDAQASSSSARAEPLSPREALAGNVRARGVLFRQIEDMKGKESTLKLVEMEIRVLNGDIQNIDKLLQKETNQEETTKLTELKQKFEDKLKAANNRKTDLQDELEATDVVIDDLERELGETNQEIETATAGVKEMIKTKRGEVAEQKEALLTDQGRLSELQQQIAASAAEDSKKLEHFQKLLGILQTAITVHDIVEEESSFSAAFNGTLSADY